MEKLSLEELVQIEIIPALRRAAGEMRPYESADDWRDTMEACADTLEEHTKGQ